MDPHARDPREPTLRRRGLRAREPALASMRDACVGRLRECERGGVVPWPWPWPLGCARDEGELEGWRGA
jgi:hypothetical protein